MPTPTSPDDVADATANLLAQAAVHPHFSTLLTPLFIDRARLFANNLALWGKTTNLTAQPDKPDEIVFHILDSLAPLSVSLPHDDHPGEVLPHDGSVLDIGSGAGFPGLILAAASPARFVLAESRRRRASFLAVAAAEMGLTNVRIMNVALSPTTAPSGFALTLSRAYNAGADFFAIAARALTPHGNALLYLNPAQPLDLAAADACGFGPCRRAAYVVPRAGRNVARELAAWRRGQPPSPGKP